MTINKVTIEDIPLRGKTVFIRADFNVPLDHDGNIADDRRIRATLPTINYAIDEGAKIVLASHLKDPQGVDPRYSLAPIVKRLGRFLGKEIMFSPESVGPHVRDQVERLKPGDVLLLENLRFYPEEQSNDPAFAKALADLGIDVYINDAFGTAHRNHASITGITRFVKTVGCGFLMKKEIAYLVQAVANPARPFVAILGGAKVSGKIGVIENLEKKVDKVIIGGGMAFTFLKAAGHHVGKSLVEDSMLTLARDIRRQAIARGVKFYLPVDCVVGTRMDPSADVKRVPVQEIPDGWIGLDIGPASVHIFTQAISDAKTILWNGPMGVFEMDAFSRGTSSIAHSVAHAYALTIVGGGETAEAVYKAGESDNISFISTGGGASIQLLEGREMPGLSVLPDKDTLS